MNKYEKALQTLSERIKVELGIDKKKKINNFDELVDQVLQNWNSSSVLPETKDKYLEVLESYEIELTNFISDNWNKMDMSEKGMEKEEACTYLCYDTSDMSREEIDDAVSKIQLAYYTEGGCSFDELVDMYLCMIEERENI